MIIRSRYSTAVGLFFKEEKQTPLRAQIVGGSDGTVRIVRYVVQRAINTKRVIYQLKAELENLTSRNE